MPLSLQINLGHVFVHGLMLLLPTVALALEADFDAPYAEVIALGLPSLAAYALCHVPAGWLGDRVSRRLLLKVYFLGLGASAALAGLAQGPASLALALCLIGAFGALYHPVAMPLLALRQQGLGLRLAINGVFGSLGVAGAPLLAGGLSEGLSWRFAFILPGLLCFLIGLLPDSGSGAERRRCQADNAENPGLQTPSLAWLAALGTSVIVAGFCYDGLAYALPKALQLQGGVLAESIAMAGLGSALILGAASLVQLALGGLSDRVPNLPLYLWLLFLRTLLLSAAALSSGPLFVAAILGSVALTFAEYPLQDKLLAVMTPDRLRSRAFAAKQMLAALVAVGVIPLVAGTAQAGFLGLFLVLTGLTLFNLGLLAFAVFRREDAAGGLSSPT